MRILMASKFLYPRGGLERVLFDESDALEAAGHDVLHFATRHPENLPSPYERYFAPYLEIGAGTELGTLEKVRAVARMFRNGAAAGLFGEMLDDGRPDLVHVHGIHRQLSPSILFEASRRSIPVVHTLHDYHLVCPADVMLRGQAAPCLPRACKTIDCSAALRNRCTRGSIAASAIAACELSFQRLTRAYERTVTRFISPSRFLRDLMIEGGWTNTPIDVVPPGTALTDGTTRTPGEYALFAGRLSPEKGISVFLSAARAAGIPAVVAGDGPLADALRAKFPEARFTGHVTPAEVTRLLDEARVAVVPSVSLENAPLGVLEAMGAGVPIIASSVGGVPELIGDGIEGLLVPPGDTAALTSALQMLSGDRKLAATMGIAGRARVSREFTPERHLSGLLETYARATGELA
ncbi:MAG: glycosyltransferase [Actinomycetota bacterium]|nr:glycosyltransferase [Actinomycetota bacterium]